jgi:MYXO-CTERM domain-containing protein
VLLFLGSEPSFALASWIPGGDSSGGSHSAPGPVIGVGLPALIAFGGYVWYRRRHHRK